MSTLFGGGSNSALPLRGSVTTCSNSFDPLDDIRRSGFSESKWHSHVAEKVLDELLVHYDDFFAIELRSNCIQWKKLSAFRKRRQIKKLLGNLINLLPHGHSHESSRILIQAACHRDVSLTAYRSLAISALSILSARASLVGGVTENHHQKSRAGLSPLVTDRPHADDTHLTRRELPDQIRQLFIRGLVSTFASIASQLSDSLFIGDTFDNVIASDNDRDFIRSICSSRHGRRLFMNAICMLLPRLATHSDQSSYQKVAFVLISMALSSASEQTASRALLYDAEFFQVPLCTTAAILFNVQPFDLPILSFLWACDTSLSLWNAHPLSLDSGAVDFFLLRSIRWLHAALVHLLTVECQPHYAQTIISFVSTLFVFSASATTLPADERAQRKRTFQTALATLTTTLRTLAMEPTLQANRILAPFRQFSSRCNLVAKITVKYAPGSSSLHPLAQALLCLFLIMCPPSRPYSTAILESLLSNDMPDPLNRVYAILEAAEIIVLAARGSMGSNSLLTAIAANPSDFGDFLQNLVANCKSTLKDNILTTVTRSVDKFCSRLRYC